MDVPEVANECEFSMLYYPPIFSETVLPKDTVRCAEHTDYEIMTFLFQNQVGGLEVTGLSRLSNRRLVEQDYEFYILVD